MDEGEVYASGARGFPRLLWGIMIRPRDTLRYLNERGGRRWWLPALLAVLMAVLPVIVGAPMAAEQAREAVLANQERMAEQQGTELSEEQRAQMEGVVASPLIIVVFPAVAGVLGLVVGWLMWSGVLYLTGMVFGGRSTFGALFRVVVWTWWPYVLRGLLQTAYIAVSRQLILNPGLSGFVSSVSSADEIIVASPNMGQLVLSSLLARVDLFLFWRLALVVVGTVVVMRISWRKAVLIVGLIWLLLTALGVLPALVGGMFSGLMAAG